MQKNFKKIQKPDCLQENLDPFIASIYMSSSKMLKERIRVVCCSCYARGEHLEGEVVKTAKATTRGRERSPQAYSLCLCRERGPQPESQETPKSPSSSSPVGSPFHW